MCDGIASWCCRMGYFNGGVLDKYFWKWEEVLDVKHFRYCLSGSPEARLAGEGEGGEREKEKGKGRGGDWGPQAVALDELIQHEGGDCLKVDAVSATGPSSIRKPLSAGQCPFEGGMFVLSNDTSRFHGINAVELDRARAIEAKVLSFSTGFFLNIEGHNINSSLAPFPQQPDCNDLWSPPSGVMSLVDRMVAGFSGGKPFAAIHWRRYVQPCCVVI